MISYRQFRLKESATPAPDPVDELERQIDALFDELKQRIRTLWTPRAQWLDDIIARTSKIKGESLTLEHYHELTEFISDFQEALSDADVANLDKIVDEFKGRFKQIMTAYRAKNVKPPRKPRKSTATPTVDTTAPAPAPAPVPAVTTTTEKPVPAPAEPTVTTTVPASTTTTAVEKPAPASASAEPAVMTPEEGELIKMGAMLHYLRDVLGITDDPIPESEWDQLKDEFKNFDPAKHAAHKDFFIKIAKEYKDKHQSPAPMKGDIEAQPGELPVPKTPHEVSEAELMVMDNDAFRQFILDHDPEIEQMYEGEHWWDKKHRGDIVANFLIARKYRNESVRRFVDKYKALLRQSERPQFLLREAVKLPLSQRAKFYREKLSCRGKLSAT
jgi:hypothetical protein